jgi:hypothetical protein
MGERSRASCRQALQQRRSSEDSSGSQDATVSPSAKKEVLQKQDGIALSCGLGAVPAPALQRSKICSGLRSWRMRRLAVPTRPTIRDDTRHFK